MISRTGSLLRAALPGTTRTKPHRKPGPCDTEVSDLPVYLWKSGSSVWIQPSASERQQLGQCKATGTCNSRQKAEERAPRPRPRPFTLLAPTTSRRPLPLPLPASRPCSSQASCWQLHPPGLSIPKLSFTQVPPTHNCLHLFPSHGQLNSTFFFFHSTTNQPSLPFVCHLRIDKTFSLLFSCRLPRSCIAFLLCLLVCVTNLAARIFETRTPQQPIDNRHVCRGGSHRLL